MVEKKKVSARPPKLSVEEMEKAFISEGVILSPDMNALPESSYPWEEPGVRADVFKIFNFRMNEPCFLKLKYIAEKTRKSINSICLSLVEEYIDKELEKY